MDILAIINYIKQNSNKGLLETTLELMQNKFEFNLIILIDNSDRSKVIGHKFFNSYEPLQQYIAHLPMKYGFMYFHKNNNTYNAGASFFDQGWMCIHDDTKATVTDYYDDNTSLMTQLSSLHYDQAFDCSNRFTGAA